MVMGDDSFQDSLMESLSKASDYLSRKGYITELPDKIYRYRPMKHVVDEIRNHYIHCSPLSSLSDPYDCNISPKIACEPFLDDDELNLFSDYWGGINNLSNYLIRDCFALCCFSETNSSFPMWDHYSASHKGVCVEYDTSLLKKQVPMLWKVKYRKNIPKMPRDLDDPSEASIIYLMRCILTKNRDFGVGF